MKNIIDKVDDGFNFFNSGILEELTTDKKYYVEVFMEYIEYLEKRKKDLVKRNEIECVECKTINSHDTDE